MIELPTRSFNYLHNEWSKPYIHMVNGADQIIHGREEHRANQNNNTNELIRRNPPKNKNGTKSPHIDHSNKITRDFGKMAQVHINHENNNQTLLDVSSNRTYSDESGTGVHLHISVSQHQSQNQASSSSGTSLHVLRHLLRYIIKKRIMEIEAETPTPETPHRETQSMTFLPTVTFYVICFFVNNVP